VPIPIYFLEFAVGQTPNLDADARLKAHHRKVEDLFPKFEAAREKEGASI